MKPSSLWGIVGCACLLLSCTAGNIPDDQLYDCFLHPPKAYRPLVWWHWMDGNVTQDGIRKDLEWMNRAGIGGFHHFDAAQTTPQIVENRLVYMHDEWKDAFRYAIRLADSLDLSVAVASSPGWSSTGGPWVSPENSMKKLVWREMTLTGGSRARCALPEPFSTAGPFLNKRGTGLQEEFYRDIAVVAVKVPESELGLAERGARVSSSSGSFTVKDLTDGDLQTGGTLLPGEEYGWIQYAFQEPQTFCALNLDDGRLRSQWACTPPSYSTVLEVSDNGKDYTEVVKVPSGEAPLQTIDFPSATGRFFRIRIRMMPESSALMAVLGYGGGRPRPVFVPEFRLFSRPRINHAEEKAAFGTPHDLADYRTPDWQEETQGTVLDITEYAADDRLDWDVPPGRWKIYRFGYSLTGKHNSPAPAEATGLEVDKLDPEAWDQYFHRYLDMYQEASGGFLGERGITSLLTDSYEAEWQTWTARMPEEFLSRRGYDLIPWLPVLAGEIIGSSKESEQFLWDWRKTIGELYAENYDRINGILSEYGLRGRYSEAQENGRVYAVDGMDVKRTAMVPMSAIWMPSELPAGSSLPMATADIRESASVAHLYGQERVAAESLTCAGILDQAYSYSPERLKPIVDLEFAHGINQIVIHESAHQPSDAHVPGLGLGITGQWFNRHETWAEYARPWTDYMARTSYLLSQGRFVADILCYYGEDSNITAQYGFGLPELPEGYNFDFINPTALTEDLKVEKDALVMPGGMRYKVLLLDRNCDFMSVKVLRKLADLAGQGARIVGQAPLSKAGRDGTAEEFETLVQSLWGSGVVYASLADALKDIPQDYLSSEPVRVVHRDMGSRQVWWVSRPGEEHGTVTLSFNIEGFVPQIWNPVDGSVSNVPFRLENGRTVLDLDMDPDDARFVVFSKKARKADKRTQKMRILSEETVEGPWKVRFQKGRGAPEDTVFKELASYTESEEEGVRYFSGTASYLRCLSIPEVPEGKVELDLGEVKDLAEVIVNGQSVGVLWKKPFKLDVTQYLKPGMNDFEIRVTNLWVNRLIGDEQPDCAERITYTGARFFRASSPLLPSGLLGPVVLRVMN